MNKELFEEYPVKKAVLSLALPTMLGMVVTIIYNMADTIFVGQTGDPNQIAAITLSTPVYLVLMAFGNILGIGGGTYIAKLLGQKEYDKILNTSSFVFYIGIVISIISGIFVMFFMDYILKLIGTSSETYMFSKNYLSILALGTPFIFLQIILPAIIRSEGSAKFSMVTIMIGTLLNIVLDPIMITTMGMGVTGAAIATVIGNAATVFVALFYFVGKNKKTSLTISPKKFKLDFSILKSILIIGIPTATNNLLMSFATVLINNFAAYYGDNIVASLGIANRINLITVLLFVGLSFGTQPFIAYSNSAKHYGRMNEAIKFAAVISVCIGVLFLGITLIFAPQMVSLFIKDSPQVVEQASYYVKAIMSSAPILGMLFIFSATFQALEKVFTALFVSFLRQCIIFVPVIFIANYLFQLNGIVWAQPIADIVSVTMATILYTRIYKKFNAETEKMEAEKIETETI